MKREFLLACVLVLVAAVPAMADGVLHYSEGQRVDPQSVREVLMQDAPPAARRTRSIRLLQDDDAQASAKLQPVRAREPQPEPRGAGAQALSLPVQFAFDSAEILPAARTQLDALAQGIKLLPPQRRVTIEGHTDASGSEDYNLALSRRRAAAVKAYLVQSHGIDAQRLRELGQGERQPIAGHDPQAGENRRVQFYGS